jgi:hypothetical protein
MKHDPSKLRVVDVIRYVTPLREGGSMPAIAEANDEFLYVVKFRGAGQGTKALVAEIIGGELARALGFKVPEIVYVNLDEAFGRTEPDEEIQDLLKASVGLNLGLHYLSGSITYDPAVVRIDHKLASQIVWLDCLLTNMDRTPRNTNMLMWHKELWLIDHGACLYFHHAMGNWKEQAVKPFLLIKDHVLLSEATLLQEVDFEFKAILTDKLVEGVVAMIPDDFLEHEGASESPEEMREIYSQFLKLRIANSETFINEANNARATFI